MHRDHHVNRRRRGGGTVRPGRRDRVRPGGHGVGHLRFGRALAAVPRRRRPRRRARRTRLGSRIKRAAQQRVPVRAQDVNRPLERGKVGRRQPEAARAGERRIAEVDAARLGTQAQAGLADCVADREARLDVGIVRVPGPALDATAACGGEALDAADRGEVDRAAEQWSPTHGHLQHRGLAPYGRQPRADPVAPQPQPCAVQADDRHCTWRDGAKPESPPVRTANAAPAWTPGLARDAVEQGGAGGVRRVAGECRLERRDRLRQSARFARGGGQADPGLAPVMAARNGGEALRRARFAGLQQHHRQREADRVIAGRKAGRAFEPAPRLLRRAGGERRLALLPGAPGLAGEELGGGHRRLAASRRTACGVARFGRQRCPARACGTGASAAGASAAGGGGGSRARSPAASASPCACARSSQRRASAVSRLPASPRAR